MLAANSAIPDVDPETIFTKAPLIQYEQILLNKNFRQHLETIMVSKKILKMGAQKTPIQKTYEINTGSDSLNVEFLGWNRQFDWIEIFIVPDKSDKHTTIYNSYNRELTSQTIKTLQLSNLTEIYSLTNEKKIRHRQLDTKTLTLQTVRGLELQWVKRCPSYRIYEHSHFPRTARWRHLFQPKKRRKSLPRPESELGVCESGRKAREKWL